MTAPNAGSGPFDRVRQEFDRWFETAKVTGERALDAVGLVGEGRPGLPAVDLWETDHELHLLVDLPGVAADGVELTLLGSTLQLKARRQIPVFAVEGARQHLRERPQAGYERSVTLPIVVDPESVRAVVRDGLLSITLKKRPDLQARPIPVQRGDASPTTESAPQ